MILEPNICYKIINNFFIKRDGTTDVTRTLHFGTPTADEKDSYTRVLLGNLDIERTIWPRKWKING